MPEARIEIAAEDGCLDAYVACPEPAGRHPPVILLGDRRAAARAIEAQARRLAARGYFVLAPDWARRSADDRRDDADAWLDHLADERAVDDTRVAVIGQGAGANLAMRVAAWRSERVTAVAAYGGHGFGPKTAREIAERINGVVRLSYALGAPSPRIGVLEAALAAADVDFEVEIEAGEPDWSRLLDLLARTIDPVLAPHRHVTGVHLTGHNP